ncbi:MAG: PrgI family protein [Candidatus Peribacteraceae bacterium]|nr:PrgI family protein [Candidatus Peribacteraceae bacterium]
MAIDPVKIPTDIQIEEKIVGPIGLRQIFILMITGGVSYGLWSSVGAEPTAGTVVKILCWLPLILGAAFSFVKIQDVTLLRLLLLQIEKVKKPAVRTFGPREGISINIQLDPTRQEKKRAVKEGAADHQLHELSTVLDTGLGALEQEADTANEAVPTPKQNPPPNTNAAEKKRPVNPARIAASPKATAAPIIDDITPTAGQKNPAEREMIRDLTPPA